MAGAAGGSAIALYPPKPLRAEAPLVASPPTAVRASTCSFPARRSNDQQPDPPLLSRKPIYDDPNPYKSKPTPTPSNKPASAPSPSPVTDLLALRIRSARLFLAAHARRAEDTLDRSLTRVLDLESSFLSTLASLRAPPDAREPLLPSLLYVAVAGMAGAIASRQRGILVRGATPLVFAAVGAELLMPVTAGNVRRAIGEWEERKMPGVARVQGVWAGEMRGWARRVEEVGTGVVEGVERSLGRAREGVEGWVRKG